MKKIIIALGLLILGLAIFTGCSKDETKNTSNTKQDTKLEKINVGYLPSPGHVLYFVAKEKGYFTEEGLDATLFQFTNSGEGLNALKAGKIDVGTFGTAAPLTFISKGADFTIFGGQQTEGHGIVAKPEKAGQLKELKDYKGKTIATVRLATGDVIFRGALKEAGIDWSKDLTIKELESPAAVLEAVKKGSVDAGIVWTPFIKLAEKQGLQVVIYSGDLVKGHTCCRQVTNTEKLKANPETYKKLMRALIKSYEFYKTHEDETVEIVTHYVKVDKDIIKAETYSGHIFSIPDPDKAGVEKFWGLMNNAGYIKSDKNIADFINTDIYKNALESLIKENPDNEVYKQLQADFKG